MARAEPRSLLVPGIIVGLVALFAYGFYQHGRDGSPSPPTARDRRRDVLDAPTWTRAAIEAGFGDSKDAYDPGGQLFAEWSSEKLRWSDISAPDVTIAQAEKDIEGARRKVLCESGVVIEIQRDGKFFVGGLATSSTQFIRFIAVGDSGDLVKDSAARFCGVVVGRIAYANVLGGVTNSIQAVGMFDLPKNRTR